MADFCDEYITLLPKKELVNHRFISDTITNIGYIYIAKQELCTFYTGRRDIAACMFSSLLFEMSTQMVHRI